MESSAMKKKASKPAIEKRRRARINDSVTQLAEMVMTRDILNQNRPVRLQKSHILEKAVDYIKNIKQREHKSAEKHFQDGYRLCMSEVENYLSKNRDTSDTLGEDLKRFLVRRMGRHLQERWNSQQSSNQTATNYPITTDDSNSSVFQPFFSRPDVNENHLTPFSVDIVTVRNEGLASGSSSDSNGYSENSGGASCSSEDEPMEDARHWENRSPLWRPW